MSDYIQGLIMLIAMVATGVVVLAVLAWMAWLEWRDRAEDPIGSLADEERDEEREGGAR